MIPFLSTRSSCSLSPYKSRQSPLTWYLSRYLIDGLNSSKLQMILSSCIDFAGTRRNAFSRGWDRVPLIAGLLTERDLLIMAMDNKAQGCANFYAITAGVQQVTSQHATETLLSARISAPPKCLFMATPDFCCSRPVSNSGVPGLVKTIETHRSASRLI